MRLFATLAALAIATTFASANADDLRIARPLPVEQHFQPPELATLTLLDQPVFCPVLLCHGTCQHREGPCTLRTFNNLLSASSPGDSCCAADKEKAHHDQCGSSQCCE